MRMLPFITKYQIRKNLRARSASSQIIHGDLINSVAVFACLDSKHYKAAKSYAKQLRERGIRVVDLFVFVPNKKALESFQATLKDFPFCPSDFSFFGGFLSPELEHSLTSQYEVALDLTNGESLFADLVMSRVDAQLRAGFKRKDRLNFLDFMIDTNQSNFNDALSHLDKYLFHLNNNQHAA